MAPATHKKLKLYEEAKAGLGALMQQTVAVFVGFIIMLVIAGGAPSGFVVALSFCLGTAFVAWSEKKRIETLREVSDQAQSVKLAAESIALKPSQPIVTRDYANTDIVHQTAFEALRELGDQTQLSNLSVESIALKQSPLLTNRSYVDADIIHLATFLRNNPNPILAFSPDGEVIKTNPAAVRLLKRLQVETKAILPADHVQIVMACLAGQYKERTSEVTVNSSYLALTYRVLPAFKLVYLYAIELTGYRQSEANLLKIASKTLELSKQTVLQLQALRQTQPQPTVLDETTLEQRLVTLEAAVSDLQHKLEEKPTSANWLEKLIGSVSDEAAFREALEYGRAFRQVGEPHDGNAEDGAE